MRIASNYYSNLLITSSQTSQQQLAQLQQQISTGQTMQLASDDPELYAQTSATQASLSQLNTYSSAASLAAGMTAQNNQAMTSLHQILANASELATSVNGTMSTSNIQAIGTEVSALVSQLTSIANQKSPSGTYLFGGTSNQPPITGGAYNSATNGTEATIEIQPGNAVTTGIVAGRAGSPGVDGFLYDSASGTDVLAALNQTVTDLNAGNASAVQADLPALNKALNLISSYVGSTAASMSAVQTAGNTLQSQVMATTNQLNAMTQTNLPNATLQLQQIQTQYQASLAAGSRVLSLSILNYLPNG